MWSVLSTYPGGQHRPTLGSRTIVVHFAQPEGVKSRSSSSFTSSPPLIPTNSRASRKISLYPILPARAETDVPLAQQQPQHANYYGWDLGCVTPPLGAQPNPWLQSHVGQPGDKGGGTQGMAEPWWPPWWPPWWLPFCTYGSSAAESCLTVIFLKCNPLRC